MSDVAVHGVTGAARHPERPADLAFLGTGGHPPGLLAARFDTGGHILAAAVVRRDAQPAALTAAQRVALAGLPDDGAAHTRTVPGLGASRVTALDASGIRVLAGLAAPSSASDSRPLSRRPVPRWCPGPLRSPA
ncbi:hypothetical protein ACWDZ8_08620 [Streptomyces sp. NPDC003233]